MTRNLITELLIRLLGIWLLFDNFRFLLSLWILKSDIIYSQSGQRLLSLEYFGGIIISFCFAVLIIKYSGYIANLIWKDRENEDEIMIEQDGEELLTLFVTIIGLYISVSVLPRIISQSIKFAILSPGYSDKVDLRNTIIAGLSYEFILFIFGIFLFTRPEKIINFRKRLRREPLIDEDEAE